MWHYETEEKWIQVFGGEASRKQHTWKTSAQKEQKEMRWERMDCMYLVQNSGGLF